MAFLEPFIAGGEAFGEALGEAGEVAGQAAKGIKVPEGGELKVPEEGGKPQSTGKHHKITKTQDGMTKLKRVLQSFEAERVLVGIPSNKDDRVAMGNRKQLNNATIGIIMEKGSPAAHIPARPWLAPGILSAKSLIIDRYEQAAKSALRSGNTGAMTAAHKQVGALTAAAVKRYITSGKFAPLSPRTVAARAAQRRTGRRGSETKYLALVASGMAPAMAQNVAGIRPLINSGQMRNAVSYVVRKRGAAGTYRGTKAMRVI